MYIVILICLGLLQTLSPWQSLEKVGRSELVFQAGRPGNRPKVNWFIELEESKAHGWVFDAALGLYSLSILHNTLTFSLSSLQVNGQY